MLSWLRPEKRASIEDPSVPISSQNILSFLGLDGVSSAGEKVTIDSALGVPAVWAAVNFLSGTIAGLPLHVYRRSGDGRERIKGQLANLLHDAPNDEMSSFEWRKYLFDQVFTHGRGVSFIERNGAGTPINIWPLDPPGLTIRMVNGRRRYHYNDGVRDVTYEASEVIDLPFMLCADRFSHRSPIMSNKNVIGLAQAVTKYGAKYFANGGVPPFAIEGPFQSPGAAQRASEDLMEAVRKASKENRLALTLPTGHTIKSLGSNPEQSQMVELQRFMIEQVARIYSMPPTFLQDLTHGTFSNTEQQDLHFVKHTMKRWIEQFEQEVNLKLFGRRSNVRFVEFNVDGLLRGDFKTRMDGYAQAIQNAVMKPIEARRRENLPDDPQADVLLVQGATVPLGTQGGDENGS
jgi:HK97 family phage portal protein